MEDNEVWFTVDDFPAEETPVLVIWKTRPIPQKVDDAYDIPDAFWFAEVASWRYYKPEDEAMLDSIASRAIFFDDEDLIETEEIGGK